MTELRWPQAHASGWLWECIYHSIYVCSMFRLSCALVFCHMLTIDEPLTNVNNEGDDELLPLLTSEMIRWIYNTQFEII